MIGRFLVLLRQEAIVPAAVRRLPDCRQVGSETNKL